MTQPDCYERGAARCYVRMLLNITRGEVGSINQHGRLIEAV